MIIRPHLTGRYRLRVLRPDGQTRLDTGWFDNLVVDGGLNQIGLGSFLTHCSVGTSNQVPAVTNSALIGHVATTSTILSQSASAAQSAPYYGSRAVRWRFAAGTATGNLSEVGVGWSSALFSRALIVDDLGDPTTITVLADEALDVTYELRNFAPVDDIEFTATIAGVSRDCIVRACNATSGSITSGWGISGSAIALSSSSPIIAYNGTLGTVVQSPNGTAANASSTSNAAYVGNSLEKGFSADWQLANGNLSGGISCIRLATNGLGTFQIGFDPPIAKTDTNTLSMTFKVAWGRPA
ncbi:MAG: hypothetical protein EOM21_13660 [Gammaproteobacteria bacterium]|nr:hypothetical protein [Gammaproteobacteria bacterium]